MSVSYGSGVRRKRSPVQIAGIGSFLSDAWDTVTSPLDDFLNGGVVGDFMNSDVGKAIKGTVAALAVVVEPSLLTSVLSGAPAVGASLAVVFANPIVANALPALLRGERVDHAFVDSAKLVAQRIIQYGGGAAIAQQYASQAIGYVTQELAASGITPAAIAAYNDSLRVAAGLKAATDELPAAFQAKLNAYMAPILAKLDPKALAAKYGLPLDQIQVAINGVTRTDSNFNPADYDPVTGNARTYASSNGSQTPEGQALVLQLVNQNAASAAAAAQQAYNAKAAATQRATDAQLVTDSQIVADAATVRAANVAAAAPASNTKKLVAIAIFGVVVVAGAWLLDD